MITNQALGTFNYAEAFGLGGLNPDSKPLQLDSTYWIASCTKLITTICALQCVEKGLFFLDSPEDVKRLIPEMADAEILTGFDATSDGAPITQKAEKKFTLRQMLTHSSGMGYDAFNPALIQWRKTRGEGILTLSGDLIKGYQLPLLFEPGEGWEYSAAIDWAGMMVERANDGVKLGEYMRKHIWDSLGMTSTTFHLEDRPDVEARLPDMSARAPTGDLTYIPGHVMTHPARDDLGGAGSYSSAPDYIKILASLLRNDGKLLQQQTVDEMFKPQLSAQAKEMFQKVLTVPEQNEQFTGGMKIGTSVNWGLGGLLVEEDIEGGRKKGSMAWGGLPNLYWVRLLPCPMKMI